MNTQASPVVSVIIPTYNRAYCLPATLDSLLAQTHPHWEALVVDDGSSDGTGDMMRQRYGAEARIRYVTQENRGAAAARNHGLQLATGDFISFLDSDDICEPWKFELQIACFHRHPHLGMVWTDMAAVDPDGVLMSPTYLRTMYRAYEWFDTPEDLFEQSEDLCECMPNLPDSLAGRKLYSGEIFSQMMMGNLVHTSTVMLARWCAEKVGTFREDLRLGEDFCFHARTCREAPVGYLDVSSILYQVGRSDALTHPSVNVHCAEAFLHTLQNFIREDGERIRLPQTMLDSSLAYAHRWLGEELILKGDRQRGREMVAASLRYSVSTRALGSLARACLPEGTHHTLRSAYRRVLNVADEPAGVGEQAALFSQPADR